jgi:hypothetical protein
MDVINSSLSSLSSNRVEMIYNAQLELATVEKALEINRYFQVQIQEQVLGDILDKTNYDSKDSEDLKK